MSAYETFMVISTKLDEEKTAALQKRFTDLIAENGKVVSVEEWGRRRLAYEIQKETDGYFVLVNFECEPSFITELERLYRITDGLLRTLVVRREHGHQPIADSASFSEGSAEDVAVQESSVETAPEDLSGPETELSEGPEVEVSEEPEAEVSDEAEVVESDETEEAVESDEAEAVESDEAEAVESDEAEAVEPDEAEAVEPDEAGDERSEGSVSE